MTEEEYKNTIKIQFQMINELIEKIDKAIEYIKLASNKFEYLDTEETKELLEILGDKENETYTLNPENMNISYMKGENTSYYKEV